MTKKTADLAKDTALSLAMMVLNVQKREVGKGRRGEGSEIEGRVKRKEGRREGGVD